MPSLHPLAEKYITDKFPASTAFDAINDALSNDEFKKYALKQGKAVFGITLKNKAGETESWFIDLAKEGKVAQGLDKSDGMKLSLCITLHYVSSLTDH